MQHLRPSRPLYSGDADDEIGDGSRPGFVKSRLRNKRLPGERVAHGDDPAPDGDPRPRFGVSRRVDGGDASKRSTFSGRDFSHGHLP